MRHTDIVIVGGGLAGSIAAAMLGRAGIDAVLIDPHPVYPADFRCEKLDADAGANAVKRPVSRTTVLRAATPDREVLGGAPRPCRREAGASSSRHSSTTRSSTLCAAIPPQVEFIQGKVADIATSAERQTVKLSNGEEFRRAW